MTVRPQAHTRPKRRASREPERLSLRWFIIATAAGAAYLLGATTVGPAAGVVLACMVATLLHRILE